MKVIGSQVEIEFQNAADGLVSHGEEIKGFAVAGADKKFVWAQGRIDRSKIVVTSAEVNVPVAVRYAWGDNPEGNLFNRAGLPASPFRTDNWTGITTENR